MTWAEINQLGNLRGMQINRKGSVGPSRIENETKIVKNKNFQERFRHKISVVNKDGTRTQVATGEVFENKIASSYGTQRTQSFDEVEREDSPFSFPSLPANYPPPLSTPPAITPIALKTPLAEQANRDLNYQPKNHPSTMRRKRPLVTADELLHLVKSHPMDDQVDISSGLYVPSLYEKDPVTRLQMNSKEKSNGYNNRSQSLPRSARQASSASSTEKQQVKHRQKMERHSAPPAHHRRMVPNGLHLEPQMKPTPISKEEPSKMVSDKYARRHPIGEQVQYTPYTQEDYKVLKEQVLYPCSTHNTFSCKMRQLSKMKGLGPNLASDELKEKREKFEKMKDYANMVLQLNQQRCIVEVSTKRAATLGEEKKISSRERALEFASRIPKPRLRIEVPSCEKMQGNGEDRNFEIGSIAELDILESQHNRDVEWQKREFDKST